MYWAIKSIVELLVDTIIMTMGSSGQLFQSCSFFSQHSLVVVRTKHLHWLGLRSLKEVSAGKVVLKDNPQLCYTQPFEWTRLFKSAHQIATIHNNKPSDICGEFAIVSESC